MISSTLDYSTDLISLELERRGIRYLRMNRDQLSSFNLTINVDAVCMTAVINGHSFVFKNNPNNAIYYRAPTFLRSFNKSYSITEQLYHSQWSAFVRDLAIFDKVKWVNNPVDTYKAENKLLQLSLAKQFGLKVPETLVTNSKATLEDDRVYAVKSIDTAVFSDKETEMFAYTSIISGKEIRSKNISYAPIFLQEYLEKKIDIRATYIEGEIFPISITSHGLGITGDWRKTKRKALEYAPSDLPTSIESKLDQLMKSLHLVYGGIDLAKVDDLFYFIEVNPTGEWHWLQNNTNIDFCSKIVDTLVNQPRSFEQKG